MKKCVLCLFAVVLFLTGCGAEKMEEISVSCVCDFAPKRLVFASYECGEKELAFRYDGRLNFSIPAGTFAGYGIVIAEK